MSDGKPSVAEWVDQELRLGKPSEGTLRLTDWQRDLVEAINEPGVELRIMPYDAAVERERILRWAAAFGDPDIPVLIVGPEERPAKVKADMPRVGSFWSE